MFDKLERIEKRYEELNQEMSKPEVVTDVEQLQKLAKEMRSIQDLVSKYREYKKTDKALEETRAMLGGGMDGEMTSMIKQEISSLEEKHQRLSEEMKSGLLPKDPRDERDIIMEIRGATGGTEAALFAADLFRMYSRYALSKGWNVDVIDCSDSGIGGFKEIVIEIRGKGAYSRLKYETGAHRVQRVPVTEASGRIHTSTATVAVLPEADEVDISINPNDLRTDIFHSGGAGGQNVNKVSTAVRITHIPTGIVAVCQDERSQLRNRQKAMAVLRARLLDIEQSRQEKEITDMRRSQVGTGDRAEKIRTYNFPQDRVTDHRIGVTLHNLPKIMQGQIDDLIDALIAKDQAAKLEKQLV